MHYLTLISSSSNISTAFSDQSRHGSTRPTDFYDSENLDFLMGFNMGKLGDHPRMWSIRNTHEQALFIGWINREWVKARFLSSPVSGEYEEFLFFR